MGNEKASKGLRDLDDLRVSRLWRQGAGDQSIDAIMISIE